MLQLYISMLKHQHFLHMNKIIFLKKLLFPLLLAFIFCKGIVLRADMFIIIIIIVIIIYPLTARVVGAHHR